MAQKISVIIPNFNGKDVLSKNLPSVIINCPNCEIIVVDDGSSDDSVSFIKENYQNIRLIVNSQNLGFARAIDTGVKAAKGKYVLLLNSDVSPRSGFLKPLIDNFLKNHNLFAVAAKDISHENGKTVEKGRGWAKFEKGFVSHFPIQIEAGETFWVSGGSGLFNREVFLRLGGFDKIYAPFYWEDIDLSFQARKLGYICLFEPASIVDHFHGEGSIKSQHKDFFIKTVSYKNQFIFVWKNISDYSLILQHFLWFPFHVIRSIIKKDWAFFVGYYKAVLQIPGLVLNYQILKSENRLSDKEILSKFEKQ